MAKTFPITEEQKQFLETFRCERLKSDPNNRWIIQSLYHPDDTGLVDKVKACAWEDDLLGTTAYYVIKNSSGQIVLLFSLKCGVLFNPNSVAEWVSTYEKTDPRDIWKEILEPHEMKRLEGRGLLDQNLPLLLESVQNDPESPAIAHLQSLLIAVGRTRYKQIARGALEYLRIQREKRSEPNKNIVCVPQSYSAIELVEFCSNDAAKGCWNRELMGGKRMGETLFWWFIAPKMMEIGDIIGCEYVFLFAANNPNKEDKDGKKSLIKYYHDLHFRNIPNLGTAKPNYDYECQFLCQRLRVSRDYEEYGLDYHYKNYFWCFNVDPTEDPNAHDYA